MLYYNGIYLNLLKVHEYKRETVYSATDYVRTRYTLIVRAVINPATSGAVLNQVAVNAPGFAPLPQALGGRALPGAFNPTLPGGKPPVPSRVVGQQTSLLSGNQPTPQIMGAISDAAILHDLMQPQQQLVYEVGGIAVLRSPAFNFTVDSANGPRPLFCNVVEYQGPRSVVVDYGIQTELNECPTRNSYTWYVLSHTFKTDHIVDQDFFTKRIVTGRVIFDSQYLNANNAFVRDDFRWLLLHPVPTNCKRQEVKVHALEDGVTYEYQIVDAEMPFNISSQVQVTRIEGVHLAHVDSKSPETAAFKVFTNAIKALERGGKNAFTKFFEKGEVLEAAIAVAPTSKHLMRVRVWGTRNSTRNQLQGVAEAIISARQSASVSPIGVVPGVGGFFGYGLSKTVTHDINGKYVEVEVTFESGPISTLAQLGLVAAGRVTFFPQNDNSGTIITSNSAQANLRPPDDQTGTRGTFIERAISQALRSQPCATASTGGLFTNRAYGPGSYPTNLAGQKSPKVVGGGGGGGIGEIPTVDGL